jgi:hypothetical protein
MAVDGAAIARLPSIPVAVKPAMPANTCLLDSKYRSSAIFMPVPHFIYF